jgi:hypothetical protein
MRITWEIFLVLFGLPLTTTRAEPAPADNFTPVVPLFDFTHNAQYTIGVMRNIALLDPAKIALVKDGITLKELVDALGPGYKEYGDGTCQWFFSDTQTLYAKPVKLKEEEVLSFMNSTSKTLDDKMWWVGPPKGSAEQGFIPVITLDDYFYLRIKSLAAEKASLVKEGMTLKELVNALGPPYMRTNEGVGVVHWFFPKGHNLSVWPRTYKETETLSFKNKRAWWEPRS